MLRSCQGIFAPGCFKHPIKRLIVSQGDVLAEVTWTLRGGRAPQLFSYSIHLSPTEPAYE
jgi:hypothetical protein